VFQETLNKEKWQQGGSRLQCCCSFYSSIIECYFSLSGWSDIVNTVRYYSDISVTKKHWSEFVHSVLSYKTGLSCHGMMFSTFT
jgi:hypothetical protein